MIIHQKAVLYVPTQVSELRMVPGSVWARFPASATLKTHSILYNILLVPLAQAPWALWASNKAVKKSEPVLYNLLGPTLGPFSASFHKGIHYWSKTNFSSLNLACHRLCTFLGIIKTTVTEIAFCRDWLTCTVPCEIGYSSNWMDIGPQVIKKTYDPLWPHFWPQWM